jgi:hypothetical protein
MTACGIGYETSQLTAIPGPFCRLGLACLVMIAATLPFAAHAQQWRTTSDKEGIKLESRSLPGERFDELRASTLVPVAPQVVADFLVGDYLDQENSSIHRTFIKRSRDLTIWSDVLTAPAIDARCYSMQFERVAATTDGEFTIRFSSGDYIGAKPETGCITLRARGKWTLQRVGDATRVTYTSLTDIGGSTPAMLVRSTLSSAAVNSVRKVVAGALGLHAQRQKGKGSSD